jgi:transcriptional regulator with XRE-family HTH domain
VALQISALREAGGISLKELTRKLKTSQQQISRLESPPIRGALVENVAPRRESFGRDVSWGFEPAADEHTICLSESPVPYRAGKIPRLTVDRRSKANS